jgi:hypothetical protein
VGLAAANALEGSVRMIASALASANFRIGLLVGHSRMDALKDLAFCQTRVFEPRDLGTAHDGLAIQMTVKNKFHGRVRETDKLQGDGVDANGVELVGAGNLDDLRIAESSARQVGRGFGAHKEMLANVRGADQLDASIIADPRVLQLDDLGDFLVGRIEPLELLNSAGPHPRLVQRTEVREEMLITACQSEGAHTEKQSLVPHAYSVEGGKREAEGCAWVIPGIKDRCKTVES